MFSKLLMGKKSIHSYVRAQVVTLHDAVFNWVQISKELKLSRCCVQNVIKKYEQLGRFDDLKHTRRPKKLSAPDIRHLKRSVKGNSSLSASKVATDLNASLLEPVTTRTRRRYLINLAFEYLVKIKKIQWLGAHYRQQHIPECKQYLNWAKDDWRKVSFSDELTFYVLKRKNQCKL